MHHRIIPLLLIVLAAACAREPAASVPAPRAALVDADPLATEPWRPPVAHQRCAPLDPPLASVAQLADSTAIATSVHAADEGHALWTVSFDGNGMPADLRLLESTIDGPRVMLLTGAVRQALRPQEREMFVRLLLDAGADELPRMRLGGVQFCQAALVNLDAVRLAMGAVDREGQVELELYIDQDGRVQERQLVQSSGDETTDRMVMGLVGDMQYSPARLERLAIPSRLIYRVNLD